jgi:hypothetical protein
MLIARMKYDTVVVSRDYYIAPTDYILLYSSFAAIPSYIVVYFTQKQSLQVRITENGYCSFHNEYHLCGSSCDGHGPDVSCLGHKSCRTYCPYGDMPASDPYSYYNDAQAKLVEEEFPGIIQKLAAANSS